MRRALDPAIRGNLAACSVRPVILTLNRTGDPNVTLRGVRPMAPRAPATMIGPAMTLRALPNREDLRQAIADQRTNTLQGGAFNPRGAGQVLFCEAAAVTDTLLAGDFVTTAFKVPGGAGIVPDGDTNACTVIEGIGLPVYAARRFASHRHIIALNAPVDCGGGAVFPGEGMAGIRNCVAAIPRLAASEVAEQALEGDPLKAICAEAPRAEPPLSTTCAPNNNTVATFHASRRTT